MAYIYKITNNFNGKIYVGATTRNPNRRFTEHCRDAKRFPDRPFYAAINKYGKSNFSLSIIEECDDDELNEKEVYWIEILRSFKYGYNVTYGGSGKQYADYDIIYSLWNKGMGIKEIHDITSYDRLTIRRALDNVSSFEIKDRTDKKKSKPVAMIDPKTNMIKRAFSAIGDAYRYLGKQSSGHIKQACIGERQSAYGYKWEYI